MALEAENLHQEIQGHISLERLEAEFGTLTFVPSTTITTTSTAPTFLKSSPSTDQTESITSTPEWAGSVHSKLDLDDWFKDIQTTFTVPQIYPSTGNPTGTQPASKYDIGIWVGIDGSTAGHTSGRHLLKAGTVQTCEVEEDGDIKRETFAFWFWETGREDVPSFHRLASFPVSPGDTITVKLEYLNKENPGKVVGAVTHRARILYINRTRGVYTSLSASFEQKADEDPSTKFRANLAEWVVENWENGPYRLAEFGMAFFYGCRARTAEGEERALEGSRMVGIVRGGECLVAPEKVGERGMVVYNVKRGKLRRVDDDEVDAE
ncbi:hypothetical protein ABW19_dt0202708 [Dactylella cylindrospora]|nr:hypothetical protein ABW19_dt0202708 [Dactylella cylindrospora]